MSHAGGLVHTVHTDDTIVAPEIARKIVLAFEEAEEQQEPEVPTPTRREPDIIASLARNLGNKHIARDLAIS